jgi:hypothetical protein
MGLLLLVMSPTLKTSWPPGESWRAPAALAAWAQAVVIALSCVEVGVRVPVMELLEVDSIMNGGETRTPEDLI